MRLILLAFLLFSTASFAQTLPRVTTVQSNNYHEICRQLDRWFAERPELTETDCWDNDYVKYQRWKWYWRDRVNPDGSFPDLKAQWNERRRAQAQVAAQRDAQPVWQNEGPTQNPNGGYWGMGRTKHVAFHPADPNIMYVGTPDGGIWRTTDGGGSWTPLGDGLPYLPVSIIRINEQNPDVIYISLTGKGGWWEYGLGVYKSVDAGQTWQPTALSYELADYRVVYALEMHPDDPQTLIAATNNGIFRTTDGGDNWTQVRTGEWTDVKYRPGAPDTLYAAYHNYWGNDNIFRSIDGGLTWAQMTQFSQTQNELRLAVTPANPDFVGVKMSQGKRFLLSKDAGVTFADISEMPEDWQLQLSARDSNVVYACGTVVSRSDDQGHTWTQITNWYNDNVHAEIHADVHDVVPNPHNVEEVMFCNDGGIYRYNEVNQNWVDHSSGLGIAQFYRIAVSEQGFFRLAAGSQDNGGWLRKNAQPASTWVHTNGGDAMTQAIDPTNSAIMFTEYYGGTAIYRSTNSWLTNIEINANIPGDPSGDWVTPFIMNPQRPASMLFGFDDVFRTYDRGDHFEKISQNLTGQTDRKIRDVRYAPSDTNVIGATWSSRVYISQNGGQTWLTRTVPGGEEVTRLAFHPSNPARMWVSTGGYSAGKKVWTSTNSGLNWINISIGLPNAPVNCVIYDSTTNYLLAGTDIGVYYTDADVINWQPYGQGMPNVWVLDLQIRQTNRRLFAGTHGRGVYSAPMEEVVSTGQPTANASVWSVFPNPAQERLYIRQHIQNGSFEGEARLYDATGRLRLRQSIGADAPSIGVSHLAPGVYYIELNDTQGRVTGVEKVVVMR